MIRKIEINNYISEKGDNWNFILSYQLFGKPLGNSPVVLVNHSLTGNSNLTGQKGWWKSLVGKNKIIDLEKISSVEVSVTFDPPWTPEMMTNYAREKLGYDPVKTNKTDQKINAEWE